MVYPVNRNVIQLSLAQALMMSVTTIMVTSAALIGVQLADNKALATLPMALQFIAVMMSTIPASMLMQRIGRKAGFLCASAIGFTGGLLCLGGLYLHSFELFCVGAIGTGIYTAFGHYFRFAATEVADASHKNTAISYVLAGGVLAALVGPNLANLSKDVLTVSFAGTLIAVLVLYLLNAINIATMRLPRPVSRARLDSARGTLEIARQPVFITAVASAAIGYAVMVLLMTATPLAMTHEQHDFSEVAFVIQWHVLGMFVPSFFTGHLINRFGAQKIILSGVGLMLCCLVLNLHGISVTHFWIALTLLGVGWNFMFIGGTSLLTEAYRPEESARAQGLNDFVVFSGAAIASLSAGALLHFLSWQLVNYAVIPFILLALAAHTRLWLYRRRELLSANH